MEQSGTYKITERLIPESQIEALVEKLVIEKLAQMLGINATAQPNRQWYNTKEAYPMLGLTSAKQLTEMVRNGTFRVQQKLKQPVEEYEVRDKRSPSSQIPRYQFHIEKCEARLSLPPEQRQIKKAKKTA